MVHQHTRFMTCFPRKFVAQLFAVALPFIAISPLTAHAQVEGSLPEGLQEALQKAFQKGFDNLVNTKVLVTPSVIRVDSSTRTATLTFTNATKDTLETSITAGLTPPDAGTDEGNSSPLVDEKTQTSAKSDSTYSLASWIKDLPSSLKLAPGEKKSVTVKLSVPADAKPGEYFAWIVTSTKAKLKLGGSEGDGVAVSGEVEGMGAVMQAGAKMVYQHGASSASSASK